MSTRLEMVDFDVKYMWKNNVGIFFHNREIFKFKELKLKINAAKIELKIFLEKFLKNEGTFLIRMSLSFSIIFLAMKMYWCNSIYAKISIPFSINKTNTLENITISSMHICVYKRDIISHLCTQKYLSYVVPLFILNGIY